MDEATLDNIEQKLDFIALSVNSLEVKCFVVKKYFLLQKILCHNFTATLYLYQNAQKLQVKQTRNQNLVPRLEAVERKQDELLRVLTTLRSGVSSSPWGLVTRRWEVYRG